MVQEFTKELLQYGKEKITVNPPFDAELDKNRLDRVLDNYSNTWLSIQQQLEERKKEILQRTISDPSVDINMLSTELEKTITEIRKTFISTYPLDF